jgi:ABC-type Fe3+ transport system substrate-binding protein
MNSKVAIVLVFLLAAGAIFYFTMGKQLGGNNNGQNGSTPVAASGEAPKTKVSANATPITLLYSTEKEAWIKAATEAFEKDHPDIDVKLVGKGSLEAANAIVDGKEQPTLWSPADSLVLGLAGNDWQTKNGGSLFAADGTEDAPQALVITPLVFAIWEDRADVLLKSGNNKVTWKTIHDAVVSNQGWPAVGGKSDWGFVKLGHTDPTLSNSGLQALVSMSFEFYKKSNGLTVADVLDPKYQTWVKEIEKGVTKFETSTGTFMTDMVRFGPSKYDLAVVYESTAVSQLENAQGRWGNLKIYYPATTLWSDHPVALLQAPWVNDAQKKAARSYITFLRSKPMQEMALNFGFRPADPSVPIKGPNPNNPFNRLAPYGVQIEIPPAANPPETAVVRNLLTMWSRVVANH